MMEKRYFRSNDTQEPVAKWPWVREVSVRAGVAIPIDSYKFTRQAVQSYSAEELTEIGLEEYTPIVPETNAPEPSTDPKDYSLTRRQLRLGLLDLGITDDDVVAQIEAIPDETAKATALIEWQDAQNYDFEHPLVVSLITAIGLDGISVSAAWLAAKEL